MTSVLSMLTVALEIYSTHVIYLITSRVRSARRSRFLDAGNLLDYRAEPDRLWDHSIKLYACLPIFLNIIRIDQIIWEDYVLMTSSVITPIYSPSFIVIHDDSSDPSGHIHVINHFAERCAWIDLNEELGRKDDMWVRMYKCDYFRLFALYHYLVAGLYFL